MRRYANNGTQYGSRQNREIAALRLTIEACRIYLAHLKAGFDPNQARIPGGQRFGGRWVRESAHDVETIVAMAKRITGPRLYDRCIDLCYPLLERPGGSGASDRNTWDFHKCMNLCLGRVL